MGRQQGAKAVPGLPAWTQGRPTWLWAVAVFVLCQLAAWLGYRQMESVQAARDQARLQRFADRLRTEISGRVGDWEDFLLAARGFEAAASRVGAKDWEAFSDQFDFGRHPGMKSLARIVRVPKDGLNDFLAAGLSEGILYNVRPPGLLADNPEDAILADAPDHYLIRYAAPQAMNTSAIGLDVGRNPVQRAAADRARDSGRPALTGKLLFNDLGGTRPAAALFLPLYRGGTVPALQRDRRRLASGWLSVGLHLDDTFAGVTRAMQDAIAFDVADLTPLGAVPLWRDPRLQQLPAGFKGLARAETMDVGGRTWRFQLRSLPSFEDGARNRGGYWIAGGALVGFALALSAWSLAGTRERAYSLAKYLTRATREALQRFETLMKNVPLAVIDWDESMRVRVWNPAAGTIFGRPARDATGRTGEELGFPPAFLDSIRRVLSGQAGGAGLQGSGAFPGPAGREIFCVWTHTPLWDAEGRAVGVTSIVEDVTGHRQEEEALRLSQKLESLGVLAGGIAHDFNNLLLGISGNAELALQRSSDAQLRTHLERVLAATRRAAELARQMLAYAGRAPFQIRPLDLNAEVREILDLLRASLPKIVDLRAELSAAPAWIEADVVQIHQVLVNLISNGAEAIGDRPGVVKISTAPLEADETLVRRLGSSSQLVPGPCLRLTVEDDGEGMEPAVLARIFDPFFTTKFAGRGLGLSSVLGIIKAHRGGLEVTSQAGRGTVFQLYLPCLAAPVEEDPDTLDVVLPAARNLTILFADDEPTLRELAHAALDGQGHRTLLAMDGQEALARFQEAGKVDVVVLDLTMPRMGGLEAFRRIRELDPAAKVILSSGYSELALDEAMQPKPDGFLHKPYRIPELLRMVEELAT